MQRSVPSEVIRLKEALQSEVQDSFVSPQIAEMLGKMVTAELLQKLAQSNQQEYRDEKEEIVDFLSSLRFKSESEDWSDASSLVVKNPSSDVDQDE